MRKNQWMIATVICCGLTVAACSTYDNPVVPQEPEEQEEQEEITGGNVNNFDLVPANEGDPEVVAALQSIPNVTDIKPFMNVFFGQAYYFNYIQPIDHENEALGTFKQQVVLSFSGKDNPVILHTEGYQLQGLFGHGTNRLDSIDAPQFVTELSIDPQTKLDVNCVQVEYRYHGFSLPEGVSNKFNYLSAKQQSADLHNIVTALKKALFTGKWLSTGVSKNGMTTAQYAYYYPNDVDMYVPFVAPVPLQVNDLRIGKYMIESSVKDYLPQIQKAFEALVDNQDIFTATREAMEKKNGEKYKDEELGRMIIDVYQKLFDKQSYGNISAWHKFIPTETSTPAEYGYFFALDSNDECIMDFSWRNALTRGLRQDPFEAQIPIDQGNMACDYSWVMNGKLLSEEDKKDIEEAMEGLRKSKTIELEVNLLKWLETTDCKMYFVYGEDDPWTGAAIPDPTNPNVKKYIVPRGTHNDWMHTYEYFGGEEGKKIYIELVTEAMKNLGML